MPSIINKLYKSIREDFEFLETIRELHDWMGPEENFYAFMKNPTKEFATELYMSCILLWLGEFDRKPIKIDSIDFLKLKCIISKYKIDEI